MHPNSGRRTKFTPAAREKFLESLAKVPNVALAAASIGMSTSILYRKRKDDPELKQAWDDAIALAVGKLEAEARRRAVEGFVRRPVFHPKTGEIVGHEMEFSDTLLSKLLAAHHPAYRNRHEIGGPGGKPIEVDTDARERVREKLAALHKRVAELNSE